MGKSDRNENFNPYPYIYTRVWTIDVNGREFLRVAKFLREFYPTIGRNASGVLVFRKKNSRNKLPRKINS